MLEITTRLTTDDLRRSILYLSGKFHTYSTSFSYAVKASQILYYTIVGVVLVMLIEPQFTQQRDVVLPLVALVLLILFRIAGRKINQYYIEGLINNHQSTNPSVLYQFHSDTVKVTSVDSGEITHFPYSSILSVEETQDYFFIFVTPITAHTIPKYNLAEGNRINELREIMELYQIRITQIN